MDEQLREVDREDIPVGPRNDGEFFMSSYIHRWVHLIVTDGLSKILLQKRATTKKLYPDCYTSSVSGAVTYGKTCEESLSSECEEEIGQVFSFQFICKFLQETEYDRAWSYFYKAQYNDEILTPDRIEVSQLKWVDEQELREMLISNPWSFTPPSLRFFKYYLGLEWLNPESQE